MNRLCNWKVIFEYEDGTTVEMHRVLDNHRDYEHIDDTIANVIQEAGVWGADKDCLTHRKGGK
jgi:hypothetical protein